MADEIPPAEASRTQIVVLICCYNGKRHLDELLPSLQASQEPLLDVRVVVVDDRSPDGSAKHVEDCYSWVECITSRRNRGFAGANVFGWMHVRKAYPRARYLVLLNQDTTVRSGWLTALATFLDAHPRAAAAQPKILLYDQPGVINTVGNRCNYLGYGMLGEYGQPDNGQFREPMRCAFPSGCAVMLRIDRLREVGLFDARFYMYQEDVDLGWKLRQAGNEVWTAPKSEVLHKYVPGAHLLYYDYLERNRWIVVLTYYRCRTLLAFAPAFLIMELGQLLFAATNGLLAKKLVSYWWFSRRRNIRYVLARRRRAAAHRQIEDRQLLQLHVSSVHLPTGDPAALRWLGNPLLKLWWAIARHAVR